MTTIASRLQAVRRRIESAATAAGRAPGEVQLIAVSKTFSAQAVCEAIDAGQAAFGENYLQEGLDKIAAVDALLKASAMASPGRGRASPPRDSSVASSNTEPLLRPLAWGDTDAKSQDRKSTGDADHSAGVASPQAGPLLRPPEWHFIGPIQSNKTRLIAENFSWVHSVDRLKIVQRLSDARPSDLAPLNVCIQVNVSGEASKSGVAPDDALPLALAIAKLPRIRLRGLMAIPEPGDDMQLLRHRFAMLRQLRQCIVARGLNLDSLSMGMSDDLESAIAEGATLVRVGRAIFGQRRAPSH